MFFTINYHSSNYGAVRIKPYAQYDYWDFLGIDKYLEKNNNFRVVRGKKWYDIIGFYDDSVSHFAISKRLKTILENYNLTGWKCFPIIIDEHDVDYYVFQVLSVAEGFSTIIDNTFENGIVAKSWDGSDFFSLRNSRFFVCTEKVHKILKREKIKNIYFDCLLEM